MDYQRSVMLGDTAFYAVGEVDTDLDSTYLFDGGDRVVSLDEGKPFEILRWIAPFELFVDDRGVRYGGEQYGPADYEGEVTAVAGQVRDGLGVGATISTHSTEPPDLEFMWVVRGADGTELGGFVVDEEATMALPVDLEDASEIDRGALLLYVAVALCALIACVVIAL